MKEPLTKAVRRTKVICDHTSMSTEPNHKNQFQISTNLEVTPNLTNWSAHQTLKVRASGK